MANDKDKRRIYESFGDSQSLIFLGILAAVYFIQHFGGGFKLLPPLKGAYYGLLAVIVLTGQIVVWKIFKHFQGHWYKIPMVYVLFVCEYIMLLFVTGFLTWPIYLIFNPKLLS